MVDKAQSILTLNKFISEFIPLFSQFYKDISSNKEDVSLNYHSSLIENSMKKIFSRIGKRSVNWLYIIGIHRDDFHFSINGNPIKKFGSQGQQKTFLIAKTS